ncbi:MAG: Rpn family recombination-promoting nuclease/putative transposase [Bacteroidia bacterium]|nr:Rpn family recombination-promoting nuclease/putative transposase [Bacteroidia bacterium]
MGKRLVRFDWAIKHLLRDKANFAVLEGFLSVLLNETVKIKQILSSQSNKDTQDDKYNDVDILVENIQGELVIIEVQNTKEYDYFHRILYGTSKAIAEYIHEGQAYSEVKKVISITIAYFDLGQGDDYVYHGTNTFKGIHKGDILTLSDKQKELYGKHYVFEIYPEYWIIKAGIFNEDEVHDELDEWIYFFKTGEVKDEFTAPGLVEAKEKLDKLKLTPEERKEYEAFVERLRKLASQQQTQMADVKDLIKEARAEEKAVFVIELWIDNMPLSKIAKYAKLSEAEIEEIIENHKNKSG